MSMEIKTGAMIITKAADVGLDVAAIKSLMEARGIDTEKIAPEVAASRFFRMIASTEDVDGIGDVVKCDGWDVSAWLGNPALFADHKQTLEGTVARGLQAFVDTDKKCLVVDGFFLPPEMDRSGLAEFVMGLYQAGLAKGVSIGAIPVKSRWATQADAKTYGDNVRRIWEKSKLLEVSFVGIPMNEHAVVARVAKSVAEGGISRELIAGIAEQDNAWSILAKAALYAVKSNDPPPTPPAPPPPVEPVPMVAVLPPEIKEMLEAMQTQLDTQAKTIKRMALKTDEVAHVTVSDLNQAIELIAAAVEILAGALPDDEPDPDDLPPTQDDAIQVENDSQKSAPQFQRLVEAVHKHHPELNQ